MKFTVEAGSMDSKNYLRLKDKESAKGLFVGDIYTFRQHWDNNKSVLCSEDNQCAHCAHGHKSAFRFRVNFLIKEGENYVSKVFEQGWTVYDALRHLNGDYDLEKHLVKVSRTGSGPTDTVYSVISVPKGEVTPEQAKKLAKVELQDLRHKTEAQRVHSSSNPDENFVPEQPFDSDEELPF